MVSIIMPIYNRASIVQRSLDSLILQTYGDWECIVVDDGSTDDTINILNNNACLDNRFRVYERDVTKIKGAPTCRNIGLEKAKGDFIIFLDSDDILQSHCLESRLANFKKEKNKDFLIFPMGVFINSSIQKKDITTTKTYLEDFLSYKLPWSIMCPIWKVDFLRSLCGFKEGYPRLNDPELMIRALIKSGDNYKVINNVEFDSIYYPSITDWTQISNKYYRSLLLFIPDITQTLLDAKKEYLKPLLKGYLKIWYRDFFLPGKQNLIKENLELISVFKARKVISSWLAIQLKMRVYLIIAFRFYTRKLGNYQTASLE